MTNTTESRILELEKEVAEIKDFRLRVILCMIFLGVALFFSWVYINTSIIYKGDTSLLGYGSLILGIIIGYGSLFILNMNKFISKYDYR